MTSTYAPATGEVAPWIEYLARIGYVAKAVLYGTVGILAARAAAGDGGEATDTKGAMQAVLEAPFGKVMVYVIAAGLAGYAVWRLLEAVTDPEHRGTGAKAVAVRLGIALRGLVHGALAVAAFRLASGSSSGGSDSTETLTARAFGLPGGEILVLLAGAGIGGYGLYQLYRAYAAKIGKRLALGEVPSGTVGPIIAVSRFGIAARGAVFILMGFFIVRAALRHAPEQAGGMRQSLLTLAGIGEWALGAVALGLLAYGVYQLIEARYRRIDVA